MPPTKHRSKLQFFNWLPSEIVIDILSRLPIRTIVICKCVCRSWRGLLCTREFADFHLSKSVPGLVISYHVSKPLNVLEFDDEAGLQHHDLRYKPLTQVNSTDLALSSLLQTSTDGLLLLHRILSFICQVLYICNPITREYIELPVFASMTFAFGVSRMTRQHKVVRISLGFNCDIYVLGTGMWRSIGPATPFLATRFPYNYDHLNAVSLNGNLHWVVKNLDGTHCISCFDLETEVFSTFSLPPLLASEKFLVVSVGECLCVSDTTQNEVVIWLMKEYGNEKSWAKEFVIPTRPALVPGFHIEYDVVHPIQVSEDSDILISARYKCMFNYSNKTKNAKQVGENMFNPNGYRAMLHTSSFFSLSSFVSERVLRY